MHSDPLQISLSMLSDAEKELRSMGMQIEGPEPNDLSRRTSEEFLEKAIGFGISPPVLIRPSAVGGWAIWFIDSGSYVFVECDNDGDTTLFIRDGERAYILATGDRGNTNESIFAYLKQLSDLWANQKIKDKII